MSNFSYPPAPSVNINELVKVSDSYRTNVLKVLFSMIIFMAGYLAIFAFSLVLIYYGVILAGIIVSTSINWITILLALGVLLVVGMFFVFLVKFFFKFKSDEDTSMVEIFKEDQPKLFEFIAKVCEETKAPFPKKIVVSSRVNASVFYNSSFLSMFFPVRKNLEIGLGLVNSVNMSEFKAILAHEFGHFAQSSTRIGSYVYRFNKVIHNLLYDNDGWENTLGSLSSVNAVLVIFGNITVEMAKLSVRFLILLDKLISKSYMALSREMEFHADSVAVSVSGNKAIINALYRTDFSQEAYDYTIRGIYNYNTNEVCYPQNFFKLQTRNISFLAKQNNLDLENGLPIINTEISTKHLLENRVHYKDIWATHPSNIEREKNADRIRLDAIVVSSSPWELFSNPEKLQEQLSKHLIELEVKENKTANNEDLLAYFEKTESENEINIIYHDFYSYATNTCAIPQVGESSSFAIDGKLNFDDLFNQDVILKLKRSNRNIYDAEVVKNIKEGLIDTKYFEFDGKNYSKKKAAEIYDQLIKDTEADSVWYENHKKNIANWFYAQAQIKNADLANQYQQLMQFREMNTQNIKPMGELLNALGQFYHNELAKNITEDDLPWIRKKMEEFYTTCESFRDGITEDKVPAFLYENEILIDSYQNTVFEKTIDSPLNSINLDGYVPFTNAVEELLGHWAKIDYKAFNLTIKTQDTILKQLAN